MSGKGYPSQPPYPTQQPAGYPQQYPQHPVPGPQAYTMAPHTQAYSQPMQPPAYAAAPPPPYTPVATNPTPDQYGGQIPPRQAVYYQPPQQTVHVGATFDNGCRFDGIAQPTIPPPPPGYLPNRAQIAASQGHIVQGTQRSTGFCDGGSGGGFTW